MAKIFVSSRFGEFELLRKRLVRQVERMGTHEVTALDDGLAAPVDPLTRSLDEVGRSDILLLICGDSYADWLDDDRLSTTHLEFRAAMSANVPILAFATQSTIRDPRLEQMLNEVRSNYVTGELTGDADDDVDSIVDQLDQLFGTLDSGVDGSGSKSFGPGLVRELDYLGAKGLDTWCLSIDQSLHSPSYTSLIERRRLALAALAVGEVNEARSQAQQGVEIYALDWAINYVYARLLELRRLPNDLKLGAEVARLAGRRVDDLEHSPQTLSDANESLTRRRVATLILRARLARKTGDFNGAAALTTEALAISPVSREALEESARAYALQLDQSACTAAIVRLLKIYPDRAVTMMRSPDFSTMQPGLEESAIREVVARHSQVLRILGRPQPTSLVQPPVRLRTALASLRTACSAEVQSITADTSAVRSITTLDPTFARSRHVTRDFILSNAQREKDVNRRLQAENIKSDSETQLLMTRLKIGPREFWGPGHPVDRKYLMMLSQIEKKAFQDAFTDSKQKIAELDVHKDPNWSIVRKAIIAGTPLLLFGMLSGGVIGWVSRRVPFEWVNLLPWFAIFLFVVVRTTLNVSLLIRRKAAARGSIAAYNLWNDLSLLSKKGFRRLQCQEWIAATPEKLAKLDIELEILLGKEAQVFDQLGIEAPGSFTAAAQALRDRYLAFDQSFASFPNWCFPNYVPLGRASHGDLTRVTEHDLGASESGWLADVPKRIVIRTREPGFSDVDVFQECHGDHSFHCACGDCGLNSYAFEELLGETCGKLVD